MQREDETAITLTLERQLAYRGGGMVLLHDVHWRTVGILERLFEWLHRRRWNPAHPEKPGYEIVDMVTYLRLTEARPQPYATRLDLDRARIEQWKKTHPDALAPNEAGS